MRLLRRLGSRTRLGVWLGLKLLLSLSSRPAAGARVQHLRRAPRRYGGARGGLGAGQASSLKTTLSGPVGAHEGCGRARSGVGSWEPDSSFSLFGLRASGGLELLFGLDQQTDPKSSFWVQLCRRKSVGTDTLKAPLCATPGGGAEPF